MGLRNIKKNLAGMQDLLLGRGVQSQVRAGSAYNINRIDMPFAVNSTAELTALDVTAYFRARVYSNNLDYVEYIYDATDTSGIAPNVGPGSWLVDISKPITGTGTPEAVVTAPVGATFLRRDGGAGSTLYVKESGTSNTGWVGK